MFCLRSYFDVVHFLRYVAQFFVYRLNWISFKLLQMSNELYAEIWTHIFTLSLLTRHQCNDIWFDFTLLASLINVRSLEGGIDIYYIWIMFTYYLVIFVRSYSITHELTKLSKRFLLQLFFFNIVFLSFSDSSSQSFSFWRAVEVEYLAKLYLK